ncbi:ATP synthase subunit C lysine N-methyltransferase-like [Octopus sinensis]|uniref:ATP synthase subunit C lysine N-methyltransferase-like n=1 Tax=Octopus sinensis TaxID=2607531 RepID=A0A6P7SSM1_9MOLL|nr:ATP synthase subunit C lysine N-methyltransferase-like [Octopus sinensis]
MSDVEVISAENKNINTKYKLTTTGATILGISGAIAVGFYAVVTPFLSPALRKVCLPFVPATTTQVQNVMRALKGSGGGTLLDIGSGDGRIVLEAAKHGFKATGVELNIWLVLYSKFRSWRLGLNQRAGFVRQDLWKTDLSEFDNIVIFGVEQMMMPLKDKLNKEMHSSMSVVACRFPFPDWEPYQTIGTGIDTVWLYRKSSSPSIKEHNTEDLEMER